MDEGDDYRNNSRSATSKFIRLSHAPSCMHAGISLESSYHSPEFPTYRHSKMNSNSDYSNNKI